jgi:capsule polysaccharide export protein KpsC/LpsZ
MDTSLTDAQRQQVYDLYASRQRADLWQNFSRRWQGQPGKGGGQARADLGLDDRPVVLLPANVIGDSLTLGRQVFSESMTEWLLRTVDFFAARPEAQLVVRIHPGERYTKGPSVAEVIRGAFHENPLPENIHLMGADDPVNTYDLVEIADMGLVYTTTVGLEMAMSGAPVIVAGQTHYRDKGFSLDPASWEAYFQMLDMVLKNPASFRLSKAQVDQAWAYAYRFFFEYPRPFPWHLLHFWNELETWSMRRVLSAEGQAEFGDTFRYLLGEPVKW